MCEYLVEVYVFVGEYLYVDCECVEDVIDLGVYDVCEGEGVVWGVYE